MYKTRQRRVMWFQKRELLDDAEWTVCTAAHDQLPVEIFWGVGAFGLHLFRATGKITFFFKKTKLFVIGLFYLTLFKVEMSTKVVTFFMTKLKAWMAPQTSSGGHYYSAFYLSMFTSEPVLQSLNICRNNLTIEHGIDEGNLSVFLCVCPCSAARFLSLSFRRRR